MPDAANVAVISTTQCVSVGDDAEQHRLSRPGDHYTKSIQLPCNQPLAAIDAEHQKLISKLVVLDANTANIIGPENRAEGPVRPNGQTNGSMAAGEFGDQASPHHSQPSATSTDEPVTKKACLDSSVEPKCPIGPQPLPNGDQNSPHPNPDEMQVDTDIQQIATSVKTETTTTTPTNSSPKPAANNAEIPIGPVLPPNLKVQHKSLAREAKSLKRTEFEIQKKLADIRRNIHENELNIRSIDMQFHNERLDLPTSSGANFAHFFERLLKTAVGLTSKELVSNGNAASQTKEEEIEVASSVSSSGGGKSPTAGSKRQLTPSALQNQTIYNNFSVSTLLSEYNLFSESRITQMLKNYDKTAHTAHATKRLAAINRSPKLSAVTAVSSTSSSIKSSPASSHAPTGAALPATPTRPTNVAPVTTSGASSPPPTAATSTPTDAAASDTESQASTATTTATTTQIQEALQNHIFYLLENSKRKTRDIDNRRWDLYKKTRKIHKLKQFVCTLSEAPAAADKDDLKRLGEDNSHDSVKKPGNLSGILDENSNDSSKSISITDAEKIAQGRLGKLHELSETLKNLRLEQVEGLIKTESCLYARLLDRELTTRYLAEVQESEALRRKSSSDSDKSETQPSPTTIPGTLPQISPGILARDRTPSGRDLNARPSNCLVKADAHTMTNMEDFTGVQLHDHFHALFHQADFTQNMNDELLQQFLQRYAGAHMKQYDTILEDQMSLEDELLRDIRDVEVQYKKYKRENDILLLEFEKLSSALEVSGPINEEMREILIEMQQDIVVLRQQLAQTKSDLRAVYIRVKEDISKSQLLMAQELESQEQAGILEKPKKISRLQHQKNALADAKSLLDCYKTFLKDTRSKTEIQGMIKGLFDRVQDQKAILSGKKIPPIADELLNKVEMTFSQNDDLSTEVRSTSSAYENTQIENLKCLQQLRDKNTNNFHLITKKIRMQSILRLTEEERKILQQHLKTQKQLNEQQATVIQASEERDKLYQAHAEHHLKQITMLGMSAVEIRKAQYAASISVNNQLQTFDKLAKTQEQEQRDAKQLVTNVYHHRFQNEREAENMINMSKQLERQKAEQKQKQIDAENAKTASSFTVSDILQEELKENKEKLRCTICKKNEKNAMLQKCHHVFCYTCLQKRYENRKDRKCPKCDMAYSKSDFVKIYLV